MLFFPLLCADVKSQQATVSAEAEQAAAAKLQAAQEQIKAFTAQLAKSQSVNQTLRQQRTAEQKALATQASMSVTLKSKTAELATTKASLSASQASLQQLQADSVASGRLHEQVQCLQAKVKAQEDELAALKQQHATVIAEAADSASSLRASADAKAAELTQVSAALSAK